MISWAEGSNRPPARPCRPVKSRDAGDHRQGRAHRDSRQTEILHRRPRQGEGRYLQGHGRRGQGNSGGQKSGAGRGYHLRPACNCGPGNMAGGRGLMGKIPAC